MKRRRFLTQTAQALAAIGLSESLFGVFGELDTGRIEQHWQAIAASAGRRVALLVGIDRYRSSGTTLEPLSGCRQDVELQRELLQGKFGFAASDITTVLDEAATETRVDEELQRLALSLKPEDTLVFHFSGYGTCLNLDAQAATSETAPKTPAIVLAGGRALTLATLSDRLGSLPTRNAIATIDASYQLPTSACRRELRSRVVRASTIAPTSLARSATTTPAVLREVVSRPIVITYATSGLSTERRWSDFDAGVLTYTLTQSLWHLSQMSNWTSALAGTVERIERSFGSRPLLQVQGDFPLQPWQGGAIETGLVPTTPISAIGTVVARDSERSGDLDLWLGGLPPTVLSNYATGSILTVDPAAFAATSTRSAESATNWEANSTDGTSDETSALLRVSRDRGLRRTARPLQPIATPIADRPVFELVRAIPRAIQLGVALETQLSRIERVDATSALSGLRGIEAIANAEREADCWFGCSTNCDAIAPVAPVFTATNLTLSTSSPKRYTLLGFDRQPIFDCPVDSDGAIKRTIQRLQPRLQDLRAFKILSATENLTTSSLKVRVTYGLAQTDPTVPDRGWYRTRQTAAATFPLSARDRSILELPSGTRIQYRVENLGDRPLFLMLVRLDACGRLTVPDTREQVILPRRVLSVPERSGSTAWNLERDPGLVRVLAVLSERPFAQTRELLARSYGSGFYTLSRDSDSRDLAGEVAQTIVSDLDRTSREQWPELDFSADVYALDVRHWATLPFGYRIVPAKPV